MLISMARFARFFGNLLRHTKKPRRRKTDHRRPLRLETLESRELLSGITEYALGSGHAPFQITAGPNNSLYFTETIANRIGVMSSYGTVTAEISVPTPSSSPLGITVGSDGGIWFTEALKNQLGRLDPNTLTIQEFTLPTGVSGTNIVSGPDGDLYFTDAAGIGRFDPVTNAVTQFYAPTSYSSPIGLTVGPDDASIYFTENTAGQVAKLDLTNGNITEYAVPTGISAPVGITVGSDGALWISDMDYSNADTILRMTTTGSFTVFHTPTGYSEPQYLTLAPDGNIYGVEYGASQLLKISPTGSISEITVPTSGSGPYGIAVGPDRSSIWFTEAASSKVGTFGLAVGPQALIPDLGVSIAQNASANSGNVSSGVSSTGVRYYDGVVGLTYTDLGSAGFGTPWGQTRSWSNGTGYDSGSVNGSGWVDSQLPNLIQVDGTDTIAFIRNSTTADYFDYNAATDTYVPRFFSQSTLTHDDTTHTYTLTDESGDRIIFNDFTASPELRGHFKSYTDAYGNVTSVVSYTSFGQATEVRRTDGGSIVESWLYTYNADNLLSNVALRRSTNGGSSFSTVRSVDYTYYGSGDPNGNAGDLKFAIIKDSAGNEIDRNYYRYYTSNSATGYTHGLKFAFSSAAFYRLANTVADPTTASDATVALFADQYFEYDSQHRVTKTTVAGAGDADHNGLGTYTYSYTASTNPVGFNSWAMMTVETLQDGNQNIVFTNSAAEVMVAAYFDITADQKWITFNEYDPQGREVLTAAPSAVTGYDADFADLLNKVGSDYEFLSNSSGLITVYDYYSTSTATDRTDGSVAGYAQDYALRHGEFGEDVLQETWQYFAHSAGDATIHPLGTDTVYRTEDGLGGETTSYQYSYMTGTNGFAARSEILPAISSSQNGPGTPDETVKFFDSFGRVSSILDPAGFRNDYTYDIATGGLTQSITDTAGLHLVYTYTLDGLGRTTEAIDPNGHVTFTVYDDPDHEVRTYSGYIDDVTGDFVRVGPTSVVRDDLAQGYTETLTMNANPDLNGEGKPTGDEAIGELQSLERTYLNDAGQVVESDAYFNLASLTYSTGPMGAAGTEFYVSSYGYDVRGREDRDVSASGTITRTVYDTLDRVISTWVGTNDTPVSGEWSPSNSAGMTKVTEDEYDNGGVGDSNVTKETSFPGDGAARVSKMYYDWRNRMIAEKDGVAANPATETDGVHRPITVLTYDNLDEVVLEEVYDGDTVADPTSPDSDRLVAKMEHVYDDQGREFRTIQYNVDATGGFSGYPLITNYYFDHRGNLIATSNPGGMWTKDQFDGAGRLSFEFNTDGAGGTTWAAATSVDDDHVLNQTQTIYDGASNPIETIYAERLPAFTGTGALTTATTSQARKSYTASYYDESDRLTATVDVGDNGGTAWTRPATVPTRSDIVLVTSQTYNAQGLVDEVTDPRGIVSRTLYDALGRVTTSIANYTGGPVGSTADVTTLYDYDAQGHLSQVTNVQPTGTPDQTTEYVYGVSPATGSAVTSNDLLRAMYYPDKSTGAPSASEAVTYTYNALGQVDTMTDRNGTTHQYTYDVLGRVTRDQVTAFGSGVDQTVQAIGYTYDRQGNQEFVTSYDGSNGILNQVLRKYNGFGQLIEEYQSHSGAVNTMTTPAVTYSYADGAGNSSRLTQIQYSGGYVVNYNYADGIDNSISRLSSISDGSGNTLESYSYRGEGTIESVLRPTQGTGMGVREDITYDRFERVAGTVWSDVASGTALDLFQYSYDRDGNVTEKFNGLEATLTEYYEYDNLNRLVDFARGFGSTQTWTFDAVGNATQIVTDGVTDSRTTNTQNQLTSALGATLSYDGNGNLLVDEKGDHFVYDAWNRLVAVTDSSSNPLTSYEYDGLNRRISQNPGVTTDLYYSAAGQVLEERVLGSVVTKYVWSPVYVDAMVFRDQPGVRLWAEQDANYNVTSISNDAGTVQERYVLSPYGVVSFYTAGWATATGSSQNWLHYQQGKRFDFVIGLYDYNARWYSPTLQKFISEDPVKDGQNWYGYEGGRPVESVDPSGMDALDTAMDVYFWVVDPFSGGFTSAVFRRSGAGYSEGAKDLVRGGIGQMEDRWDTLTNPRHGNSLQRVVTTLDNVAGSGMIEKPAVGVYRSATGAYDYWPYFVKLAKEDPGYVYGYGVFQVHTWWAAGAAVRSGPGTPARASAPGATPRAVFSKSEDLWGRGLAEARGDTLLEGFNFREALAHLGENEPLIIHEHGNIGFIVVDKGSRALTGKQLAEVIRASGKTPSKVELASCRSAARGLQFWKPSLAEEFAAESGLPTVGYKEVIWVNSEGTICIWKPSLWWRLTGEGELGGVGTNAPAPRVYIKPNE